MCSLSYRCLRDTWFFFYINAFEILESLCFLQNPLAIVEVGGRLVDLPPV